MKTVKLDFSGKIVLITGGSSGIGEELAKRFVELNAEKVIITARRLNELERVKSECKDPSKVIVMEMDLSKPEQCLQQIKDMKLVDRVDILVNNGGLSMRDEFKNIEFKTCTNLMNVNCMSSIALINGLLPKMISQKSGQIVNILSISAVFGNPVRTLYCASKFAVDGFSKSLRPELKQYGISVTCIYPGYVKTNISKNAATGSGEAFGKVDDNNAKALPVDKACDVMLRAIKLRRDEIYVASLFFYLTVKLSQLSSTLNRWICAIQFKKQMKILNKVKNN
ncbi:short-chain dehydrogenase [Stylonychia lemnae]|uniref:Short-chain dehydrogenase n=1 Tax=Stylonychia lemnae TaxID=5949 RepID=A0A078A1G2_STYLE|nr:short-chain dehydrogenase [Stylonychia lemnae]|eukprot:CDW76091.1 short-chain dehydrogenase [Stylonychia lemnae]